MTTHDLLPWAVAVFMVTNLLGAAFSIARVHSQWKQKEPNRLSPPRPAPRINSEDFISRGQGLGGMRFVFGVILGFMLTVCSAFLHDHMPTTIVQIVNWDVVSERIEGLTNIARESWKRIGSGGHTNLQWPPGRLENPRI